MEVLCRGEKDDGGGKKEKKWVLFRPERDVIRETDRNLNPSVGGDPWNFIPPVVVHKHKNSKEIGKETETGEIVKRLSSRWCERNRARLAKMKNRRERIHDIYTEKRDRISKRRNVRWSVRPRDPNPALSLYIGQRGIDQKGPETTIAMYELARKARDISTDNSTEYNYHPIVSLQMVATWF